MATTIYRLAEECSLILSGGATSGAFNPTIDQLKIDVAQAANALFKVEYMKVNLPMGEAIPNGAALGLYEGISVVQDGLVSKSALPVKPIKLPRNMGVWSVYPSGHPELEFIPIQMGQAFLLKGQKLINDLSGQVGYETLGMSIVYTQDLTLLTLDGGPIDSVDMRLAIMDFSVYDDWEPIPIPAEQEMDIKKAVINLYSAQPIPDKTVDPSVNEQKGSPLIKQRQS